MQGFQLVQNNTLSKIITIVKDLPPEIYETCYPAPALWEWADKFNKGCEEHIVYEVHYNGTYCERD